MSPGRARSRSRIAKPVKITAPIGCGSGPFGEAAVDYKVGLQWRPLDQLLNDSQFVEEFESGFDWFDLHAKLAD